MCITEVEKEINKRCPLIWKFDINNDQVIDSILTGKRTAILCLCETEISVKENTDYRLVYDNEKEAAVICFKKVIDITIEEITEKMAVRAGKEEKLKVEDWKNKVKECFKKLRPDFKDDTVVKFILFEIKENLVLKRLSVAKMIAEENAAIVGKINCVREIHAGFNNSIFEVNQTYIFKICTDIKKEDTFDTEANFYRENSDNETIPSMIRYDKSKKAIPYVYEILEKVEGKTLFYHWYCMREEERERLICQLVKVIKDIHKHRKKGYDWAGMVQSRIEKKFFETENLFDSSEKQKIMGTLNLCDKILVDNYFSIIHNDLHFDNIFLDQNGRVRLIDFNDVTIAPFDYDFRFLYMMVDVPWKWANSEMESFQKKEDYKNLFLYVKKFYRELNDLKYLEERMKLYSILNDFDLLPRFPRASLKKQIMQNVEILYQQTK